MKQVTTDTKRSNSGKSTKAADAPETAPSGDSARPEPSIILPGKLEHWNIGRLRPYERNPRTHSPEQITKIAASLLEFGWTNPILVDGNAGIIAGHGRLLAARELGMAVVPVIELTHLTEAQRRAYVIADNRLALERRLGRGPSGRGTESPRGPRLQPRAHRRSTPLARRPAAGRSRPARIPPSILPPSSGLRDRPWSADSAARVTDRCRR